MDEDIEYVQPARGDKAEAIRRKYCLEPKMVFDDPVDEDLFVQYDDKPGDVYLCFEESELDIVEQNGKIYFIKKIEV